MSIWLSKQLITGGHAQKLFLPLCAVNMTLRLVRHTHITYITLFFFSFSSTLLCMCCISYLLSLSGKKLVRNVRPQWNTQKKGTKCWATSKTSTKGVPWYMIEI
jgi:hypothetical protein